MSADRQNEIPIHTKQLKLKQYTLQDSIYPSIRYLDTSLKYKYRE